MAVNTPNFEVDNVDFRNVMIEPVPNMIGYYQGTMLDFSIIIYGNNGYINATKITNGKHSKTFDRWWNLDSTKLLVNELHIMTGIPVDKLKWKPMGLNNKHPDHKKVSGTYIHQDLIINFASWVDVKFDLKVGKITRKFIVDRYNGIIEEKNKQISTLDARLDRLCRALEDNNLKLDENTGELRNTQAKLDKTTFELKVNSEELRKAREKIIKSSANIPKDKNLIQDTIIMDTKHESNGFHYYYAIRTQKRSIKKQIAKHRDTYPDSKIFVHIESIPNAIYLHNEIKDDPKAKKLGIKITSNTIKVPEDIKRSKFKSMIYEIYESRLKEQEDKTDESDSDPDIIVESDFDEEDNE